LLSSPEGGNAKIFLVSRQEEASAVSNVENLHSRRKFRLPKLELKRFHGDVRNWILGTIQENS
ncbi:hypothetical protein NQ314_003706, partial [Rhamnusium bicolor]